MPMRPLQGGEVLDAEVHFWSATIENNPMIRLDLAALLGCSPGYAEHLAFLSDWRVNARH
jgi:hypothetical protein